MHYNKHQIEFKYLNQKDIVDVFVDAVKTIFSLRPNCWDKTIHEVAHRLYSY